MTARRAPLLILLLALGGCETLDGLFATSAGGGPAPLTERPLQDPIDPNVFPLEEPGQTVVGQPQVVFARHEDTLSDLARTYGLGYDEIIAANPGVDPWLPGEGTPILLPTQYVLPPVERHGIVLNIATRRLFYFPPPVDGGASQVMTFPIGIGRVGWETPVGQTTVVSKARDPHWWPPASVRREHAEMGNPLPQVVGPGPDNPLGTRVLKLDMPGYLIHGTNQPYGVGMRVSHGCVRLYPENIEFLYELIDVGEAVTIVNEPYQFGFQDGVLYFEAHAPLEDDALPAEERLKVLLDAQSGVDGRPINPHLQSHVRMLADVARGSPVSIVHYEVDEMFDRARVVRNMVQPNPNGPTLTEVREMMEEADAEAGAVEETL